MTKYKQSFEKCVSKIQRTQDALQILKGNYRNYVIDKLTSELWKINHSGPGCSFYVFYEWYIFQKNTRVYITKPDISSCC